MIRGTARGKGAQALHAPPSGAGPPNMPPRCSHTRQTRSGSNTYQNMVQCVQCRKVLFKHFWAECDESLVRLCDREGNPLCGRDLDQSSNAVERHTIEHTVEVQVPVTTEVPVVVPRVIEKIVEVPVTVEKLIEVPTVKEITVEVPKLIEQVVEKVVETPVIKEVQIPQVTHVPVTVEKVVEVPTFQTITKEVPVPQVVRVPMEIRVQEKIVEVPKVEYVDKVVEIPQVIEVPKIVEVPVYHLPVQPQSSATTEEPVAEVPDQEVPAPPRTPKKEAHIELEANKDEYEVVGLPQRR